MLTSGGFVGVDVFFVISGFVITASLMRELERTERISFRAFYTRRVKRLLPALAVVLVAAAVLSALTLSPFGPQIPAAKTGIAASLFASNLSLFTSPSGYFGAPAAVNPLLHMWSLSVEEQFYVVYPLLIAGLSWWARRRANGSIERIRRTLTIVLGAISALSLALCVFLTHLTPGRFGFAEPARLAFYAPVTRAWEFIAGALVTLLAPSLTLRASRWGHHLGLVGIVLVALSAWRFSEFTTFPGVAAIVPVLGAALIIASGSIVSGGPLQRALGWSPLVWFGDVSYGWYLWHWPLIVAARMLWPSSRVALVVAAVVALVPTIISYRYIENPIRFSPRIRGARVIGLAIACVLVPLLALGGLRWGASNQWQRQQLKTANAQFSLHADELRGCSVPGAIDLPACTWTVSGEATGSMVLVGDSNAGQFSEAVLAAASELGLNTTITTSSGCPFLALTMSRPGVGYDACTAQVIDVTKRIIELKPDVVVIASASDIDFTQANEMRLHDGSATVSTLDQPATAALWTKALNTSVTAARPTPAFGC